MRNISPDRGETKKKGGGGSYTPVRVGHRDRLVKDHKLVRGVVLEEVVVRERRELRRLGDDLPAPAVLVRLGLEHVDLRRAAAPGRARPGVVLSRAGAGREALAGQPGELVVVLGAGLVRVQRGGGAGLVGPRLVREGADVARVVSEETTGQPTRREEWRGKPGDGWRNMGDGNNRGGR